MKLLILLFALLAPLEGQRKAPAPVVKDYKVPVPQFSLAEVNDPWSRLKKPVQVKEADIYYRLRGERTSSFHGRVTVRCANTYDRTLTFVFSLKPEMPATMNDELRSRGLRPALSMDRVVAVLIGDEEAQQKFAIYALSLILGVCEDDRSLPEPYMALALWIGSDEIDLHLSSAPITRERFNQIK